MERKCALGAVASLLTTILAEEVVRRAPFLEKSALEAKQAAYLPCAGNLGSDAS